MTKVFGYKSILASSTGEVGQVKSIGGPSAAFGDVDTTTLDSSTNYRTFVPGLGDPGEVTLALVYDPTLASHRMLARAAQNRTEKAWTFYHGSSTGDTDVFNAFVKSVGRETPLDNLITADVTLKVTGKPGYTT